MFQDFPRNSSAPDFIIPLLIMSCNSLCFLDCSSFSFSFLSSSSFTSCIVRFSIASASELTCNEEDVDCLARGTRWTTSSSSPPSEFTKSTVFVASAIASVKLVNSLRFICRVSSTTLRHRFLSANVLSNSFYGSTPGGETTSKSTVMCIAS